MRLRGLLSASILVVVLVACAGDASSAGDQSPWAEEFEWWRSRTSNEFILEVLSDYSITRQELNEARERVTQCFRENGVEDYVAWHEEEDPPTFGIYDAIGERFDLRDNPALRCADEWFFPVRDMYLNMAQNPNNVRLFEAWFECRDRDGTLPEGLTLGGLDAWMTRYRQYTVDMEGNYLSVPEATPAPDDPILLMLDSEEPDICWEDPWYNLEDEH